MRYTLANIAYYSHYNLKRLMETHVVREKKSPNFPLMDKMLMYVVQPYLHIF